MTGAGTGVHVPPPLDDLRAVFIPIDPGAKETHHPRTEDTLLEPDDPILNAYLDAGHNYGIACQGDLAVVDADDPGALAPLLDALPDTTRQVSGSHESEHWFLRVPGLETDIPLDDPETGENVGHVKAAAQSYVVGPGSLHPSGNRYGPLEDDTIATIDDDDLLDLIDPWRPSSSTADDRERGGCFDHDHGHTFEGSRVRLRPRRRPRGDPARVAASTGDRERVGLDPRSHG